MQDCLFCKIVAGAVPSRKVYDDDASLAFLDINPANPGHALVVSKKHYATIHDAGAAELGRMMVAVKAVADAVKNRLAADGVNVVQNNGRAAGQIVNHLHFHVIPRHQNDNVVITYQKVAIPDKEMEEIQEKLAAKEAAEKVDWNIY